MYNIATKYMVLGGDLLFVFPFVEVDSQQENVPIGHTIFDQAQWLRIGNSTFVPLDDEIMQLLKRPNTRLILTESDFLDFRISNKGEVPVEPLLVGQLMVHYEMGKSKIKSESPLVEAVNQVTDFNAQSAFVQT